MVHYAIENSVEYNSQVTGGFVAIVRLFLMLVVFGVLTLNTAKETARGQDLIDSIVATVEKEKFKRIAVLPNTITFQDRKAITTIGRLGPRGKSFADHIYSGLKEKSKGKFEVAEMDKVYQSLAKLNFSIDDLKSSRNVRKLGKEIGSVDGLIIPKFDENMAEPTFDNYKVDLVKRTNNIKRGNSIHVKKGITLSDAAYQGESWWLREWKDDQLLDRGLIGLSDGLEFGIGPKFEHWQYEKLQREKLKHPHLEKSPFDFAILVDGKVRPPQRFGNRFAVELSRGEVYKIRLRNDSIKNAYVAVYIDGVIVIDGIKLKDGELDPASMARIEPGDLKLWRHFQVKSQTSATLPGWYQLKVDKSEKRTGETMIHEFKIVDRQQSAGAGTSFNENIGLITAIFYTQGMDGIPQPSPDRISSIKSRGFSQGDGTGLGNRIDRKVKWEAGGPRGIMLAAISYYYRSSDQLKMLKNSKTGDSPDFLLLNQQKK